MALPVRMIRIHYQGSILSLLDSDDHTPIYTVKVCSKLPQMSLFPASQSLSNSKPLATASFSALSTEVTLNIDGRSIPFLREKTFTRSYTFCSCTGDMLFWRADGTLTGDFKLVDKKDTVVARFHNKVFSTTEVGSFEVIGEVSEMEKREIVISGLAMLAMVQSSTLALMVLAGGDGN